jgi:hypothetical protein
MAFTDFVNVTVDPSAAKKSDGGDHRHSVTRGGAAAGDLSISINSASISTRSLLDTALRDARRVLAGSLPP